MGEFGSINLDVLRGWEQASNPQLRRPHALPALARLVHLDSGRVEFLHGPDLVVGRYYALNGPVDLILGGLQEHELYRLGAPHVQMKLSDDNSGQWFVRHLAPQTETRIGSTRLDHYTQRYPIEDGELITIGCARYRFEREDVELSTWRKKCRELLASATQPSLFLCRAGGPCGPTIELSQTSSVVIGRTLPPSRDLSVRTPWDSELQKPVQPTVDLAGLYPGELQFISYLHASIRKESSEVCRSFARDSRETMSPDSSASDRPPSPFAVTPLATRQKTFLNRHEIDERTQLSSGDELSLGSIFFYAHCPHLPIRTPRQPFSLPEVVNWSEDVVPALNESRLDEADLDEADLNEASEGSAEVVFDGLTDASDFSQEPL